MCILQLNDNQARNAKVTAYPRQRKMKPEKDSIRGILKNIQEQIKLLVNVYDKNPEMDRTFITEGPIKFSPIIDSNRLNLFINAIPLRYTEIKHRYARGEMPSLVIKIADIGQYNEWNFIKGSVFKISIYKSGELVLSSNDAELEKILLSTDFDHNITLIFAL